MTLCRSCFKPIHIDPKARRAFLDPRGYCTARGDHFREGRETAKLNRAVRAAMAQSDKRPLYVRALEARAQ